MSKRQSQQTHAPTSSTSSRRPLSRGSTLGAGGTAGSKHLYSVEEEGHSSSASFSPTLASTSQSHSFLHTHGPSGKIDLKKEYIRFCKLYSSEPLDIVATPLEKASYGRDAIVVDLKGRGLRGVDCIALGKILSLDAPISQLNLSDCLLLPQGFQALLDGLCKNTRLEVLDLRGNNIQGGMTTNVGKLLKCNNNLKRLLVEWNCLGISSDTFQTFCDGLAVNEGLEYLDLRNNQLTADCATSLAIALRKNKILREIDLRWNSIGLAGAKALWESLRFNFTLSKIHLCGNFIPEDVVKCIEHCIKQQGEREELMDEYSKRTTLLTRQLQKTEKEHAQEINTIVSVFDAEEAEYKEAIKESHEQILLMDEKLREETMRTHSLTLQLDKLQASLACLTEKEETLMKALELKEQHSEQLENLYKAEMEKLKTTCEIKLRVTIEELESKQKELAQAKEKIKKLEPELASKLIELEDSNGRLETLQKELQTARKEYEERVKTEKAKWDNWKSELETAEKREIKLLEDEIKNIQSKMMEHIKAVEKGKADAEEEIRHLKISFVTHKTELEEESTKMRMKIKAEFEVLSSNYLNQIDTLKQQVDKFEGDIQKQNVTIRKLESDNSTLVRQNENLRQQINNMDLELVEKDSAIHTALARARTEVREQLEQLAKEEEANKILRQQNLELQEQVATLTLKQNREIQEKFAEMDFLKTKVGRSEDELIRLKEEDMRRAALLHEAFLAYMRSTSVATGLPLPPSYYNYAGDKSAGDGPSSQLPNVPTTCGAGSDATGNKEFERKTPAGDS